MPAPVGIVMVLSGLAGACGASPDPTEPESNAAEIGGNWTLSVFGAPVGSPGGKGNCKLVPRARLTIDAKGYGTFTGSHTPASLVCTGLTPREAELSGITDTIFSLGDGTLAGTYEESKCMESFAGVCQRRADYLTLIIGHQRFETEDISGTFLTGWIRWVDEQSIGRVTGTWAAVR